MACRHRFQKAVDSAKLGEDMWLLLGGANIHDAKLKKVFVAAVLACVSSAHT
jgi:hypothetical protein